MGSFRNFAVRCFGMIVAGSILAALTGCGGGGGGEGPVEEGAILTGQVVNAITGDPVSGVTVTARRGQTVLRTGSTGTDGNFRLTNVATDATSISVADPGNRFYTFAATLQRSGTTSRVKPDAIPVAGPLVKGENDVGVIGLYDKNGPPPPPIFE